MRDLENASKMVHSQLSQLQHLLRTVFLTDVELYKGRERKKREREREKRERNEREKMMGKSNENKRNLVKE